MLIRTATTLAGLTPVLLPDGSLLAKRMRRPILPARVGRSVPSAAEAASAMARIERATGAAR